jgi:ribosomal protein L18
MQKLKKALNLLKKTANLKVKGGSDAARPAAQPAKKAPATKRKSAPAAPVKKAGAKKPTPVAHVAKKPMHAAPKAGAGKVKPAPQKAEHKPSKDHKKKMVTAPAAKGHVVHPKKTHEKPVIQVIHKKPEKAVAPAKAHEAKHKKVEVTAKEAAEIKPAAKVVVKAAEKPAAKPVEAKAPEAAKLKAKKKEEVIAEEAGEQTGREEVVLTDAEGRRYCRLKDCDQIATVDGGYCRYHYLLFWKNIQVRKKILSEGKLERYIEELTARYPDKYLEMLKKDLRSEKDFLAAIQELEIDESGVDNEYEDEAQSYLEEVRGMGGTEGATSQDEDF